MCDDDGYLRPFTTVNKPSKASSR